MRTWLPPLLGFTNTSRGFMRGDGVGLMMKGLQRPSLETDSKALSCPGRPYPRFRQCTLTYYLQTLSGPSHREATRIWPPTLLRGPEPKVTHQRLHQSRVLSFPRNRLLSPVPLQWPTQHQD